MFVIFTKDKKLSTRRAKKLISDLTKAGSPSLFVDEQKP